MKQTFKLLPNTVVRNICLRIYPTEHYRNKLNDCFLARNIVYNHLVNYNNEVYAKRYTYDYYFNLRREMMKLRESNLYPLLNNVDSHMLRECVEDLDNAYKNYLNKYKSKPPQIKVDTEKSCRFVEGVRISYKKAKIYLPKMENEKLKFSTRQKDPKYGIRYSGMPTKKYKILKITQCSITQDLIGRWFATITVHAKVRNNVVNCKSTERIGIDVGIGRLATDSNGRMFKMVKNLKTEAKYKSYIYKYLHYLHTGDMDKYLYYKDRYRRYHYKRKALGVDFVHKLSRWYVNNFTEIAIENLDLFNMVKSFNKDTLASKIKFGSFARRKFFNRLLKESKMGLFLNCIKYKALEVGCKIFIINKCYTSICCSKCLSINISNRHNERFKCLNCGYKNHADINAAINIRNFSFDNKNVLNKINVSTGMVDVNLKSLLPK